MDNIIKCQQCGKESPKSGVVFDGKEIKEALSAPLDCNGHPIYDFSRLKRGISRNGSYCYWCGAKLEVEKPRPTIERKPTPPPTADPKPGKSSRIKWGLIALAVLAVVLFFCFRGCGSNSNIAEQEDIVQEASVESEEIVVEEDEEVAEDEEVGFSVKSNTYYDKSTVLKITDHSKEWTALQNRLKALGTPLAYVNSHSNQKPEKIKEEADNAYSSIKDDAYALYEKIRNEHDARFDKIKDSAYDEYNKIKDKAYTRYQNDEIDYSTYDEIRSAAYNKYDDIRSNAYKSYDNVRSEAYKKYDTLRSDAYKWFDKVRSITYNL